MLSRHSRDLFSSAFSCNITMGLGLISWATRKSVLVFNTNSACLLSHCVSEILFFFWGGGVSMLQLQSVLVRQDLFQVLTFVSIIVLRSSFFDFSSEEVLPSTNHTLFELVSFLCQSARRDNPRLKRLCRSKSTPKFGKPVHQAQLCLNLGHFVFSPKGHLSSCCCLWLTDSHLFSRRQPNMQRLGSGNSRSQGDLRDFVRFLSDHLVLDDNLLMSWSSPGCRFGLSSLIW